MRASLDRLSVNRGKTAMLKGKDEQHLVTSRIA